MKKSNFRSVSDYGPSSRKTLSVSGFTGVDMSGQQANIASTRAVYSNNYVYRDRMVQKRWKYNQVGYVPKENFFDYETSKSATNESNAINGIWSFIADDGERHYIAHVGNLLYEIKHMDTGRPYFSMIAQASDGSKRYSYKYEDFRSQAFVGQHRLWFLSGSKYMMVYWDASAEKIVAEPVAESDYAYAPTTSYSITYSNSIVNSRENNNNPNLLQRFRKNLCLSGTGKDSSVKNDADFYEYVLDCGWVCKDEAADMAKSYVLIKKRGDMED